MKPKNTTCKPDWRPGATWLARGLPPPPPAGMGRWGWSQLSSRRRRRIRKLRGRSAARGRGDAGTQEGGRLGAESCAVSSLTGGKNWERKCLAFIRSLTIGKVFCVILIIIILVATIITLSVLLSERKVELILGLHKHAVCPQGWIGYGEKCFYFSDDTRNWTFSQTFCESLGADLAHFETLEELNFLKRYKGPSDHWIGLSRESSYHIWKWTDGTEYNSSKIY
ncbi:C-type lectin domain family 2 member E-like isoform X3 [Choloepus didactylus]|uniref:C-type lectin domain family 2 member E-like isoform X3 n=1 Tax=Choloepus didactylus TaxID=27675 RepID=UPI00189D1691|nr:C-type lectin domain family 2 member E-like isoform X3 [Choloepus didactylus]